MLFEVKVNNCDGQTDKRQIDYDPDERSLTSTAISLTAEALTDAGLKAPTRLDPTLSTMFDRVTLAALRGAARLTCDLGLRLSNLHGDEASMRPSLVLLETKSQDGDSPADRALRKAGIEPLSLSKYRTGIALLRARDPATDHLHGLFGGA